jgi:hypothetical protein
MLKNRRASYVLCALLLANAEFAKAHGPRSPLLGVYAKVDVEDAIRGCSNSPLRLHACLRQLYGDLLDNKAISGLAVGIRWDQISLSLAIEGNNYLFLRYDWSFLEDVFQVAGYHQAQVQLIITPGFDTPGWVLNTLPNSGFPNYSVSCNALLSEGPSELANCGALAFSSYPKKPHDGDLLPLPRETTYKQYWARFLEDLNKEITKLESEFGPSLAAIAVAGPNAASPEIIFPTTTNAAKLADSGKDVDDAWNDDCRRRFPS